MLLPGGEFRGLVLAITALGNYTKTVDDLIIARERHLVLSFFGDQVIAACGLAGRILLKLALEGAAFLDSVARVTVDVSSQIEMCASGRFFEAFDLLLVNKLLLESIGGEPWLVGTGSRIECWRLERRFPLHTGVEGRAGRADTATGEVRACLPHGSGGHSS